MHRIVTAASCTTNCLAPVVKVLHESIGIERGAITTMHDVTNTQVIVDAPHKDLRRARSALNSLDPNLHRFGHCDHDDLPRTGRQAQRPCRARPAAQCVAHRCGVHDDAEMSLSSEINDLLRAAAEGPLAGILGFEDRPLVSADFTNDPRSGIVDGPSTMVIDGSMVKVLIWYDNEYGYVHRMAELAAKVAASLRTEQSTLATR